MLTNHIHCDKCRKGIKKNEYHYNTSDVFNRF